MRTKSSSIFVALGANRPFDGAQPLATLNLALNLLEAAGVKVESRARWVKSPAFPPGAGPDFVNGAARLSTDLPAEELLAILHEIERKLGRERKTRWSARTCDLDLIAFGDRVAPSSADVRKLMALGPEAAGEAAAPTELILPHPRLTERAFVLAPLADVAPDWRHPITGETAAEMLAALPQEERDGLEFVDG